MLGPEIGVVQAHRLFEHVLAEYSGVQAGGRNRRHVVKPFRADFFREIDGVAGPPHVRLVLVIRVSGQVVDRREVEEMVDLALQRSTTILLLNLLLLLLLLLPPELP